jgi:putative ABC transport system substrate-binding protein
MSLIGCLLQESVDEADYRRVFTAMKEQHLDALAVSEQVEHRANRKLIVELAREARLPTIFAFRDFVELGGFMAYAVDLAGAFRMAAQQVDRILNGASPAQIPFSQQTRFELVVNIKTAKAIGVDVPAALLLRADEVIE